MKFATRTIAAATVVDLVDGARRSGNPLYPVPQEHMGDEGALVDLKDGEQMETAEEDGEDIAALVATIHDSYLHGCVETQHKQDESEHALTKSDQSVAASLLSVATAVFSGGGKASIAEALGAPKRIAKEIRTRYKGRIENAVIKGAQKGNLVKTFVNLKKFLNEDRAFDARVIERLNEGILQQQQRSMGIDHLHVTFSPPLIMSYVDGTRLKPIESWDIAPKKLSLGDIQKAKDSVVKVLRSLKEKKPEDVFNEKVRKLHENASLFPERVAEALLTDSDFREMVIRKMYNALNGAHQLDKRFPNPKRATFTKAASFSMDMILAALKTEAERPGSGLSRAQVESLKWSDGTEEIDYVAKLDELTKSGKDPLEYLADKAKLFQDNLHDTALLNEIVDDVPIVVAHMYNSDRGRYMIKTALADIVRYLSDEKNTVAVNTVKVGQKTRTKGHSLLESELESEPLMLSPNQMDMFECNMRKSFANALLQKGSGPLDKDEELEEKGKKYVGSGGGVYFDPVAGDPWATYWCCKTLEDCCQGSAQPDTGAATDVGGACQGECCCCSGCGDGCQGCDGCDGCNCVIS